jgi:hypothetical protein
MTASIFLTSADCNSKWVCRPVTFMISDNITSRVAISVLGIDLGVLLVLSIVYFTADTGVRAKVKHVAVMHTANKMACFIQRVHKNNLFGSKSLFVGIKI